MFFDAKTRTEYGMLFKQATNTLCTSYGVKKEEGPCSSEKPMKKDKKDETEPAKR